MYNFIDNFSGCENSEKKYKIYQVNYYIPTVTYVTFVNTKDNELLLFVPSFTRLLCDDNYSSIDCFVFCLKFTNYKLKPINIPPGYNSHSNRISV